MPDLTKLDKLSILKRLVKRIKNWRFQKSLPMTLFLGKSDFSRSSPEFKQWLEDANEGITVIFGKYSHWLPDFNVVCYESESRVGKSIVPILEKMLAEANFAVLILTGEDETATGSVRARQNVIHEIGLFQNRLGFNRAILLKQEGVENFTNVDGLQYIPFAENRIEQTFHELIRALKREELLPGT